MTEPVIAIPEELPIAAARAAIEDAVRAHAVVVVCGETGSGKSTQLPKILLGLGRGGLIGHTQPRRIAARSLAARIADEIGDPERALVGYQVRFSDRTGPATRIKLMTDGILLAELAHDRELRRYDSLILDEAHERSLNIDFLLGYLKHLLPRRPDLKVVIASATLDPEKLSRHFDGAPVIEVSGRGFPIELRYRPPRGEDGDPQRALVAAVDEAAASVQGRHGDALVFLPGEREIREAAQALRKHRPDGREILPLYARLSASEQDRVFERGERRRVVLATNVAETSLTVPGVTAVVDTGLARVSRYGHRSKIQRLPIEPVSRASADQRMGRCGRVAPGLCIRLYDETDYEARPAFTDPEILRTNLASVILRMAELGLGAVEDFPFPDPPDARLVKDGYRLLRDLGAVDDERRVTKLGRRMARLPVDPRLARILLAAPEHGCVADALVLVAWLSIQDPRERPVEREAEADARHAEFANPTSDFLAQLALWRAYQEQRRHQSTRRQRQWCRERFLSFARMREWHDLHQELRGLVHDMGLREAAEPAPPDAVHRALLAGFIDRIGMRELRRDDRARYTGARGLRFRIFPGSGVKGTPRWIVAASLIETSSPFAMTVARVRRAWLEEVGAELLKRSYHEPHWRIATGRVEAFEQSTLYGLLVYAKRRVDYGVVDPSGAHAIFLREALVAGRLGVRPPFLAHNLSLEGEVLALEAKLRRRDLLATPARRSEFYATRVPAGVSDRRDFEEWRYEAERRDARLLWMTRDDLLATDAPAFDARDYPDRIEIAGNSLALRYRFEPGDPRDGVALTVPVALLGELGQAMLDRLVPAWLAEKIEALLWSLPKSVRRALPTTQPYARELSGVIRDDGRPLTEALADCIQTQARTSLRDDALREDALPPWLRPLLRIVDADGRLLAEDRDLASVQARFAERVTRRVRESKWEREGLTRFDIDELPAEVAVREGGVQLRAYPALEDRGNSVTLRLMRSERAAQRATRAGLARLFMLALPQQATLVRDRIGKDRSFVLLAQGLRAPSELGDQLARSVFEHVFLSPAAPPIRTRSEYEARLSAGRSRIVDASEAPVAALRKTLELRRGLLSRLASAPAAWSAAVADMREQLDALVHADFVRDTPAAQLVELPRYLHAMAQRLDKLRDGQGRDAALVAHVRPYWQRYREMSSAARAEAASDSALVRFRWMIEELRVSLFAQSLGTRERVSPQRLEKQWETVRAEMRTQAQGAEKGPSAPAGASGAGPGQSRR
jgi:ATP-dependent helicase HrpA